MVQAAGAAAAVVVAAAASPSVVVVVDVGVHAKPCTCGPDKAGGQEPQQRGAAAAATILQGQRSFIQTLV